jgi:DUF1680 family protein
MKTFVYIVWLLLCLIIFQPANACPHCAHACIHDLAVKDQWEAVQYGNVKVGGEIGRRIDLTIQNNMKKLDLDKDIRIPFQTKDGSSGGFIGAGMLLDAAVRLAAYSGDKEMIAYKDRLIRILTDNQLNNGYIGYFPENRRLWKAWDIHEMSYIITGLVSDYTCFGQKRSLETALKIADYMLAGWNGKPADFPDFHLLGIDKAMLSLYQLTGEERFHEFEESKRPLVWRPGIDKGRTDKMYGHIFAYLAVNEAQLNKYRLTADERLKEATQDAMDFMTAHDGLSIIGGAGQEESWADDQDGEGDHAETCSTAYQMRVWDNLLRLEGLSFYGDLIERSMYNVLFAAQSLDGEQIRYYTPFEGERQYFNSKYFCCPNNFRRIISELPRMIYYTKPEGGIAVNLYTASSAKLPFSDKTQVDIEQRTDYPNSGNIQLNLKLSKPKTFPLVLRIPAWVQNASVTINGTAVDGKIVAGAFLTLNRTWKTGDRVELRFPMEFRLVEGRKRQSGRVAVMRGPLVYCLSHVANPTIESLKTGFQVDGNNHPSIAGIGKLTLDPTSLTLVADSTIRKNGTACMVGAWANGFTSKTGKHHYELKLTEFADPEGIVTYFRLPVGAENRIVEDELIKK